MAETHASKEDRNNIWCNQLATSRKNNKLKLAHKNSLIYYQSKHPQFHLVTTNCHSASWVSLSELSDSEIEAKTWKEE